MDELDAQNKTLSQPWMDLLKTAEFVRDVNAQEPSLSQLAEQVAKSRAFADLQDERKIVRAEWESLRWNVVEVDRREVGADGDGTGSEACV